MQVRILSAGPSTLGKEYTMANNKKKLIYSKEKHLKWQDKTLVEIRKEVDKLLKEYGEEAVFDSGYDGIFLSFQEEESDKEYKARMARQKKQQASVEKKEKAQLKYLLKKYGDV